MKILVDRFTEEDVVNVGDKVVGRASAMPSYNSTWGIVPPHITKYPFDLMTTRNTGISRVYHIVGEFCAPESGGKPYICAPNGQHFTLYENRQLSNFSRERSLSLYHPLFFEVVKLPDDMDLAAEIAAVKLGSTALFGDYV